MKTFFAFIGFFVVVWFVFVWAKKSSFAISVERCIREKGVNPIEIQRRVGENNYANAISWLEQDGCSAKNAAGLLIFYVLNGFGDYYATSGEASEEEIILLRKLGYLR